MEIQEQLRIENRKLGQAVPLMAQAAEEIDQLKAQIGPLHKRIEELEQAIHQIRGISEGTVRVANKEPDRR